MDRKRHAQVNHGCQSVGTYEYTARAIFACVLCNLLVVLSRILYTSLVLGHATVVFLCIASFGMVQQWEGAQQKLSTQTRVSTNFAFSVLTT